MNWGDTLERWSIPARVAIAAVLIGYVYLNNDLGNVWMKMQKLTALAISASFLLNLAGVPFSALTWYTVVGDNNGSRREYLIYYFESEFLNIASPGSLFGDATRVARVTSEDFSTLGSAIGVVVERILYVESFVYVSAAASFVSDTPPEIARIAQAAAALLLICRTVAITYSGLNHDVDLWSRLPDSEVIHRGAQRSVHAFPFAVGLTITVVLSAHVLIADLAPSIGVWQTASFVPLVAILTSLPVSIRGLGIREVGYISALAAFSVSSDVAVTVSITSLGITILIGVVGAMTSAAYRITQRDELHA